MPFEKLDFELISLLVNSNEMSIRSERDVVGVILRWLRGTDDYSRKERKENAASLFKSVRWQLLEVGILRNMRKDELSSYDYDKDLITRVQTMINRSDRPPCFVDDSLFEPKPRGTRIQTLLVNISHAAIAKIRKRPFRDF